MARIGGRQKGVGNVPPLDRIKANRAKLEKMLLDKALAGDVAAIQACLELLDARDDVVTVGEAPRPAAA